jgi:hypothetical protein
VELNEFIGSIDGFLGWQHVDKIKLFAWFLHAHRQMRRVSGTDIRDCFKDTGIAPPTSISPFLNDLTKRKPPLLLRDSGGFYLERTLHEEFNAKYGQRAITVEVHKTLRELPARLPDLAEREYVEEALRCIQATAYRAAIVMCWNVAYDHLCAQILKNHLSAFNAKMAAMFPKEKTVVAAREDFYEFNEARVLEVCRADGITDKNVHGILDASLKTRNRAGHASGSTFKQPQAENYILELLNNAVLKL